MNSVYKDEPFVDVMPAGSHPNTSLVRGSNYCRLAAHLPQGGSTVVVLAVEDNLVKGAAGQAVQNMNIMFNLTETTGLQFSGLISIIMSVFIMTIQHCWYVKPRC